MSFTPLLRQILEMYFKVCVCGSFLCLSKEDLHEMCVYLSCACGI